MERGLLWLPLLTLFIALAWAGWNEYQKLEAYKTWAADFDHAKYDIYAVLGIKHNQLTWGTPTRQGPINLKLVSLEDVQKIGVTVNDCLISLENPPSKAKTVALHLALQNDSICNIPFTQLDLALKWAAFLKREYPSLQICESTGDS